MSCGCISIVHISSKFSFLLSWKVCILSFYWIRLRIQPCKSMTAWWWWTPSDICFVDSQQSVEFTKLADAYHGGRYDGRSHIRARARHRALTQIQLNLIWLDLLTRLNAFGEVQNRNHLRHWANCYWSALWVFRCKWHV